MMKTLTSTAADVSRLLRDRGGNFGIMTAILLPVLLGTVGVAIDISNAILSKRELQEATDSAALAAATALAEGKAADTPAAQSLGKDFVAGQMANYVDAGTASKMKDATIVSVDPTITATSKSYKVTVSSSYALELTPFMSILGYKTLNIATSSSTSSGTSQTKSALSMMLALDESGSMKDFTQICTKFKRNDPTQCKTWTNTTTTKIAALKQAAGALFDALDKADPTSVLVRTGAVSYTHVVMGQTSPTMAWGTTAARRYVSNMPTNPAGGTDASGAMGIADSAVKKVPDGTDNEAVEQGKKGNTTVGRFLVLMTDGEMTGYSADWNSTIDQSVRTSCDTAKSHGITVFTVAFMAPDKGKDLLQYCASPGGNYYEADTMEKLVSDFTSIAQTATKAATLLTN
jgi:Flp pilus assembly protein TadG